MEKHDEVLLSKRRIFLNNFIGGIAWGLGATIGFSVIVGIVTYILRQINLMPFIGTFATDITAFVLKNLQSSPHLVK